MPHEIQEYVDLADMMGYRTADDAVKNEEGTYNSSTGRFWCSKCYIAMGMPLGKCDV